MAYLDTLTKKVNILPTGIPTPVHLSQSENGRSLSFEIIGGSGELPAGSVVTLTGTKPDGVVYSTVGTLSGNIATFEEDVQLTAAAGVWPAKIEVTNGGHMIATGRISFTIDADPVAPGSVPSESELDGLVAQAAMYAETARSAAYGSPLTAATAADMIDTTRVYVYTGNETGMETGHWYYWENGAWKDGGIYNAAAVQTDTSLSIPGMAADAAATGRDIAAEAAAREQADTALQTAIDTKANASALTAETEAREQADADLKADLSENVGDLKSALPFKADKVYGGDTTDVAQTVTAGKAWNDQTGLAWDNTKRAVAGGIAIQPNMKSVSIASGYIMLLYGNNAGEENALTTVRTWTAYAYNLSAFSYKYLFVTIARSDAEVITSDDLTNVLKIAVYDSAVEFATEPELQSTNQEVARINGSKTYASKNLLNPSKFTTVGQYYTNDSGASGSHSDSSLCISYDDLIPVEPSKNYVLSQDGVALTAVSLLMIDSTGTDYLDGGYNHAGAFTTTASTKYVRISISKSKYDGGKIMLAQETSASPYTPWFESYTIGIREEVDALLSEASTPTGNIVCWGDSLTYGTGATAGNTYPEKLATLTGKVVHSCGFPGDTSIEIAGMQGANPMVVAPVTIPASGSVNVTIYDAARSEDYPFRFPSIDAAAGVNPVEIGGVKGNLDLSASSNTDSRVFSFARLEAGDAVSLTWYTPIITNCSDARKADIQVIFIGTNGGWNSSIEVLMNQIACMAENQNTEIKKYIVVGLTTGTASSRSEMETKMLMKFGKHYVNARDYLSQQAIYDEGITPTEQDTTDMSEGKVPTSLRNTNDATHLNDYGYDALAKLIYKQGKALGYWS